MPAHSHGRGTQDITGWCGLGGIAQDQGVVGYWSGHDCFYAKTAINGTVVVTANNTHGSTEYRNLGFKASNKWSGTSESKGSGTAHGHSWAGTQVTINHMNPYEVAYCYKRIS